MTSKASPKKHGLAQIHILRPKSKPGKRKNKLLAKERRNERQAEMQKHYESELAKL